MSKNLKRLLYGFYAILVLLIVVDLFIPKHPHFSWEKYPSFYGAYGFFACVGLVLAAKYLLRKVVMREEDYYD
ncbi:MAG: hypothetical protein KGZ93_08520 [Actinobacteria bacterium]|nr:hypothetical protein [Actinomycetota bacterium]